MKVGGETKVVAGGEGLPFGDAPAQAGGRRRRKTSKGSRRKKRSSKSRRRR